MRRRRIARVWENEALKFAMVWERDEMRLARRKAARVGIGRFDRCSRAK